TPNQLSQTARRDFRHPLRSHNLELTALGCSLRHGLDTAADQQPRIEHVRKVMALSFDLGPRITIIEAGQVPEKPDDPAAAAFRGALLDPGRHGAPTRTGPAPGAGPGAGPI